MSKNKDMYGVACKPIHKSRDRRDSGSYPPTQFPIRSGLANFLFFQIFVSLVILMMPTTLWADLISLTVDSGGDTVFRGEVDRLRIIFTVDDSDAEDPYIVEVGNAVPQGGNEADKFVSLGVIERGVVSANETVNVFWDGTVDNAQLPDKTYTIRVVVDDDQDGALTATATLDSSAPRVSGVLQTVLQILPRVALSRIHSVQL